jgi:hypothetical protein
MTSLQIYQARQNTGGIGIPLIHMPTLGIGGTSDFMAKRLEELRKPTPTFVGQGTAPSKTLDERLYDALASFKTRTAFVAMHLDREWRSRLFHQFDSLLAVEDWQIEDLPPSLESFSTFLRMLVMLRPDRRPGLGATEDGVLIATWTSGEDRLTIECMPKDLARWHLAVTIRDERERAAAITPLARLSEVLQPYAPQRWFADGNDVPS